MNAPQFVINAEGTRTAVLLDLETYEQLLEAWEDQEDVRDGIAALTAIANGEEDVIPFEQAMAEIDARAKDPQGAAG
jgi:mRNA interferase RelE/StbE